MPFVTSCYLIRGDVVRDSRTRPRYTHADVEDDELAFSYNMVANHVNMFVTNRFNLARTVIPGKFMANQHVSQFVFSHD